MSDPCGNMQCNNTTDSCKDGKCHCGVSKSLVCDVNSQYPYCNHGTCICSKTRGKFENGDGSSQGSCRLPSHKCQASGRCLECIHSGQCKGLTDTCVNNKCSCGNKGPCNSTISNICLNGICKCGNNDQCAQEYRLEVTPAGGECDPTKCSWYRLDENCVVPRSSQEVCEKVTEYYNPLYIPNRIPSNDGIPGETCDDEKGKFVGQYQCLGVYHVYIVSHLTI